MLCSVVWLKHATERNMLCPNEHLRQAPRLPEPQCPAMQWNIPRSQRLRRGHRDQTEMRRPSQPSGRWAMANEAIRGHERGAYVTLATSNAEGKRDRLKGASPRASWLGRRVTPPARL